jgi:hypothetical protein
MISKYQHLFISKETQFNFLNFKNMLMIEIDQLIKNQ